ncbi:MAG TPA: methyltransferase domain-containing protein [Gaiellaceae bacterium]|nr:methyltransferase domain-containing protein [Gaiellaceae bacterium]
MGSRTLTPTRLSASAAGEIERLLALSASPYEPEPPRRSRIVELLMAFDVRRGRSSLSPHQSGGQDVAKVAWEMEHAPEFWEAVAGFVRLVDFDGKDVLDVGCGWGGKAMYLAQTTRLARIRGFDLPGVFDPAVPNEIARERGLDRCSFTTGYAEEIPAADASVDLVLMDDVMEHVRDPEHVVREVARVLRAGGLVVARFPSIRMLRAHHFDRALHLPGLHYLMPMKTWAAGFNHYLLHNDRGVRFDPFPEVVTSWSGRRLTRDLNGLDLTRAREIVERSGLRLRALALVPFPRSKFSKTAVFRLYTALRAVPPLREPLSRTIVLVARRESDGARE